jgi:hypothetical protein
MVAFATAAGMNTVSVLVQHRWRLLRRVFGRHAFAAHLALVTPGWMVAVGMMIRLGRARGPRLPGSLRPVGWGLAVLAAALWVDALHRVGPYRAANGDFFTAEPGEPAAGGVYRLLSDPMYDAYALGLAAAGLASGKAAYLWLAAESVIVLNLVEARLERLAFAGGAQ